MFRRPTLCALALVVAFGLVGASCKASDDRVQSFATTTLAPTSTTVPALAGVPAPTKLSLRAVATGGAVSVFSAPGDVKAANTLSNPTIEGMPLAMFVVDRQGDWLQVRVPERPNNQLMWIQASQVTLTPVENRIVISTEDHTLRLLDKAQEVVWQTTVATGTPRTPTPRGRFYVDVWLPNPGRPYGTFMLSIAGFSEVYKTFEGGRGQVAMHGWADERVMGSAASNGCVRMRNGDIQHLAELAPLGTPVEII